MSQLPKFSTIVGIHAHMHQLVLLITCNSHISGEIIIWLDLTTGYISLHSYILATVALRMLSMYFQNMYVDM